MSYFDRLDPEQQRIARRIVKRGRARRESRKEILAGLETGLTESSLHNLSYGDGTSVGWRQETASSYPNVNRRDVPASINRFYDETDAVERSYRAPAALAQAVQRSAYPGRYAEHADEARAIYQALKGGKSAAAAHPGGVLGRRQKVDIDRVQDFDKKGFEQATRRALVGQMLAQRHGTDSILFKSGLLTTELPSTEAFTDTQLRSRIKQGRVVREPGGKRGLVIDGLGQHGAKQFQTIFERAVKINRQHRPYVWGGGHGPVPDMNGPWDCSGAVSALLGVSPRVSGQFAQWGRPGRGKHVTIWANSGHVLAEINGKFWGTSHSNPGGGAGWIPRGVINQGYLSAFTARHPAGL